MNANSEFLELGAVRRGKALGKSFGFLNYESNLAICPFPPIAEAARPEAPEVVAGRREDHAMDADGLRFPTVYAGIEFDLKLK